jgi:hypothetical protein
MAHINKDNIKRLESNIEGCDIIYNKEEDITNCECYIKAKLTNNINKKSQNKLPFEPLEKIYSDLWGPTIRIYNNYRYFITFLDKQSRFLYIDLLRTKDEAYNSFIAFSNKEENNKQNKRIRIY